MQQRESTPDLQKSSPEYKAHAVQIDGLLSEANKLKLVINNVLRAGRERAGREGRGQPNLPTLDDLQKPNHFNCHGAQILFHHVGMEALNRQYGDNDECSRLWPILREIASVRLSLLQFPTTKQVASFVPEIESMETLIYERASPDIQVPSVLPYLFKPQTAVSRVKQILGKEKFADPEILSSLSALFANDEHILHSACLALVVEGNAEAVDAVLRDHAERRFPQMKKFALIALFQQSIDLFAVYVTSLVESGKTEEAAHWCEMQHFSVSVAKHEKLAEKYAAALRNLGKFEQAMLFLQEVRDAGMSSKPLSIQYNMALQRCSSVLPQKLDDLYKKK